MSESGIYGTRDLRNHVTGVPQPAQNVEEGRLSRVQGWRGVLAIGWLHHRGSRTNRLSTNRMDVQGVLRWLVDAKIPVAKAMPVVSALAAAGVRNAEGIALLNEADLAAAVPDKSLL